MYNPRHIRQLEQIFSLSGSEREKLRPVTDRFPFKSNEYYLSLIDWEDPGDPIRRIIIPSLEEIDEWGFRDPSNEAGFTCRAGLQHKYRHTALLLVSESCGGYCRFCFRKRLFYDGNREVTPDVDAALEYIREHREVTNILVSGGDPLMLSTRALEPIVAALSEIDHVKLIRIGSKLPAYNPYRILNDPSLCDLIRRYNSPESRIYMMVHFNHPRELTDPSVESLEMLARAGAILCGQTPVVAGVNDDPETMIELFRRLSYAGVAPYYVFICRPTTGNRMFAVPVEKAYDIFNSAVTGVCGLAKRARLVMSHASGKIEVVARLDNQIIFRYHRAADHERTGEVIICRSNPEAYWFDDYDEKAGPCFQDDACCPLLVD